MAFVERLVVLFRILPSHRLLMFEKVVLSGFVGVFFEKVLKSKVGDLSVWDRNVQVGVVMLLIRPYTGIMEHHPRLIQVGVF